jgi:hypothetical protein
MHAKRNRYHRGVWTNEVYEKATMPPELALLVVAGTLLALVAGIVVGLVRARRRLILAATAEASIGDKPPALVEGRDVVLGGLVRHAPDQTVAVKVSITQSGSESESSGSWSHAWTEIDRDIVLAPFMLELADGKHVLVEPPKNVDVADALDQSVWIERDKRVLSAELVPGEKIFARGRLERSDQATHTGAYRDVEWGWTLRPSGGQMLLSSEPLGQGLRERATFHRRLAWVALVMLIATQSTFAWFYKRALGHTEVAKIDAMEEYDTTDSDGDSDHHYAVVVRGKSVEIPERDDLSRGLSIPIRVTSDGEWTLGASPTIHWLHAGAIAMATLFVWTWYRARRRSSRPWFRRKVNESGSGRLPPMR